MIGKNLIPLDASSTNRSDAPGAASRQQIIRRGNNRSDALQGNPPFSLAASRSPALQYPNGALRELPLKRALLLCRGAFALCQRRLENIVTLADPHDQPLRRLIQERIAEEIDVATAYRALDWNIPGSQQKIEMSELDAVLGRWFPSASGKFGEEALNRDIALYFAERVEEERARFLMELAQAVSEELLALEFFNEHERGLRRITHLRTVILPQPH